MEKVTLRDVYFAITELRNEISENYAKKGEFTALQLEVTDIKKDVKSLNSWKIYFTGVAAAVGAVVSIFASELKNIVIGG